MNPPRDSARFEKRVVDACRDRYPDAVVTARRHGRQTYLDIKWCHEKSTQLRWPVGLAPNGLDSELFEWFVQDIHASYERDDPRVRSEIVFAGDSVDEDFVRRARQRGVDLWKALAYEGWDPSEYLHYQHERLIAESHYSQELYVAQRFVHLDGSHRRLLEQPDGLLDSTLGWLDTDDACLLLVLGDFGSGKSFLLRQLARLIPDSPQDLVPILMELRNLDKNYKLNELLAQHLSKAGEDRIEMGAVLRLLARGHVALLIDGLDEVVAQRVTYEGVAALLRPILSEVTGKTKVVLTSRTQHFYSDDHVRTVLDELVRSMSGSPRIVRITDFNQAQICSFLVKFGQLNGSKEQVTNDRIMLIENIQDLLGLSRNPRMLSFIADLPVEDLRAANERTGRISSADLYRMLVDRWLIFETNRRRHITPDVPPSLDVQKLRSAVDALALRMWDAGREVMNISELEEAARDVLSEASYPGRDIDEAAHILGSSSLLVRDDDRFSFIHNSVMEYLVAAVIAQQIGSTSGPWNHRPLSDLMVDFLCGSGVGDALAAWVQRTLGDLNADPSRSSRAARDSAFRVARQLRLAMPNAQLASQDLGGSDLSELSLRRANLSYANLAGATLRHTDLTGADLRNVDLRGAKLEGAKLMGARVEGGKWDGAVLEGVFVDQDIADALRKAGVKIGQPVTTSRVDIGLSTVTRGSSRMPVSILPTVSEVKRFNDRLNEIGSAVRRGENALVVGLRKVGKTSLLDALRQRVADIPVCMVDMRRYNRDTADWPRALFEAILRDLDLWGSTEQNKWPFESSSSATAVEFDRELRKRVGHLGDSQVGPRILVILDELGYVFPKPAETDVARRWIHVTKVLRSYSQGANRLIGLVGADLRPVVNRTKMSRTTEVNPFFELFREVPLSLLDHGTLMELIESFAQAMGVDDIESEFVSKLFELTGGHPSLARTVTQESYRRRMHPRRLRLEDLVAGRERLEKREIVDSFLRDDLWGRMTRTEKDLILELARTSEGVHGLKKWQLLKREKELASLEIQGLIDENGIRIGMFREWISNEHGGNAV